MKNFRPDSLFLMVLLLILLLNDGKLFPRWTIGIFSPLCIMAPSILTSATLVEAMTSPVGTMIYLDLSGLSTDTFPNEK